MPRERTGSCRYERGAWRLQVYVGRDPATGTRRYRGRTIHEPSTRAGERAARAALAQLLLEIQAGHHTPVERGTVAELLEGWITARGPDWPAGAADHTRKVMTTHVTPTLGAIRADKLTTDDIDKLYTRLRHQGLAASTVKRIHGNLHAALARAVLKGKIPTNPATNADKPTVPRGRPKRTPDVKKVRLAVEDAPAWLAMVIRLAVVTGARRGELAPLRWDDIEDHPTGMVVTIHQTKTDTYKAIPLGLMTTAALRTWRATIIEQALAAGRPDIADGWVFPSWSNRARRTGSHVQPNSITQAWVDLRARHGLEGVRFHDLRHGMATHLISEGHDIRTVSDRGGWSSPTVPLNTYSHAVTAAEMRAARAMDDWLDGTG